MVHDELRQITREAVDGALRRGATGVRARAVSSRSVSVTYRDGRSERIEESAQRRLSLTLFVDGRYTTCDTNHLGAEPLSNFLDIAVALARSVEPDEARALPDPALYDGEDRALELLDERLAEITPPQRLEKAAALDAAVREKAGGELITTEARYQDSTSRLYQINSNGFEGIREAGRQMLYATLSVRDEGERRPSGWAVSTTRRHDGLADAAEVAAEAVADARNRLGARPIATAKLPMIVENRAVPRLLGHLLSAISGRSIQQRSSFLEGKLDQAVGSEHLDIVDDPFVPAGLGSRLFDHEGMAARRRYLFERGALRSYFLDTYYARKLDMAPNSGGASNLVITPGRGDLGELISGVGRGVLVRGFLGGNSNATTGDFSLGIYGTLIESGKLTRAVSEMNISGNHLELWRRLIALGGDVYVQSSVRSPSLLFDEVQFSGR